MFTDFTAKYADYGAMCGDIVFKISGLQKKRIEEEKLSNVFYEIEIPLIEVLASMEVEGVRAEREFLNEFGKELKEKIELLEIKIYDLAGRTFNIQSPIQLGEVLLKISSFLRARKQRGDTAQGLTFLKKSRISIRSYRLCLSSETLRS